MEKNLDIKNGFETLTLEDRKEMVNMAASLEAEAANSVSFDS